MAGFYVHKTPAIQNIKLKPGAKRFNVRFYCNDGISYYLSGRLFKGEMRRSYELWVMGYGLRVSQRFEVSY
jgi:hypothetical protein